jgi:hypothetical protein
MVVMVVTEAMDIKDMDTDISIMDMDFMADSLLFTYVNKCN